ncbi:MAG TPA: penicillin acylase family protein, partial [bacterium]|nr:penicillin acylase family protein [bacterium]
SSGNYEWRGYVPYDRLPSAQNPAAGFVATANNRQAGDDYPYYIGAIFDKGYRARRIADLIQSFDKITFEDMQAIQYDVYSLAGQNLLPVLYSAVAENPDMLSPSAAEALEILKAWDLQEIPDATAPSIFYQWLKYCTINIFKDNIPEEVFSNLGRTEVMYPIILRKKNPIIDVYDNVKTSDIRETKYMMLAQSLNDAVTELESRFGPDKTQWVWGKLHQIRLGHQLGGEFSVGPEPAPGGSDTINVADFGLLGKDFNFGHGPNMRFTVEMSPGGPRAANIIAGGQSGNRNSLNYADQFLPWIQGKTHPMLFKEYDIAARTVKTIMLMSE